MSMYNSDYDRSVHPCPRAHLPRAYVFTDRKNAGGQKTSNIASPEPETAEVMFYHFVLFLTFTERNI